MSDNVHNEILEYISDSLKAQHSPKYERYIKYFNNISSILINNNDLQCSRVILSGSMAKDTAVHHKYDCDILVYMNMGSDYDRILMRKSQFIDKVGSILKQHLSGIHSTRSTPNSFQFSIGSFDFDILPVPNLLSDRKNEASHKTSFIQYTRAIQLCHLQRRPHMATFKLKAALSEYGDEFIKERSQFIHRLIILCKHWAHSSIFGYSRFPGLSPVIELIATWVGLNLEKKKQETLLEGLKKFFEIFASIQNCAIEFQLGKLKDLFRSSYVIVSRPYVKDPINPYNNRLYSVKSHQFTSLQRLGGMHLTLTNQLGQCRSIDDINRTLNRLFKLPQYLIKEGCTIFNYKEFLKTKCTQSSSRTNTNVDERRQRTRFSSRNGAEQARLRRLNSLPSASATHLTGGMCPPTETQFRQRVPKVSSETMLNKIETRQEACNKYFSENSQTLKLKYWTEINDLIDHVHHSNNLVLTLKNSLTQNDQREACKRILPPMNNASKALASLEEMVTFLNDSFIELSSVLDNYLRFDINNRTATQSVYSSTVELESILLKMMNAFTVGIPELLEELDKLLTNLSLLEYTPQYHRIKLKEIMKLFQQIAKQLDSKISNRIEKQFAQIPTVGSVDKLTRAVSEAKQISTSLNEAVNIIKRVLWESGQSVYSLYADLL